MVLANTAQTAVRRWKVWVFFKFPALRKPQWLPGDEKVQWLVWRAERKGTHVLPGTRLSDTDFVCVAPGCRSGWWAQVALVTYGKECLKAMAAPILLRPCLQEGGEEAASARTERAVSSVRLTASLQDFLFHYGNIPGQIQVQSGCHRTFFKTGFMGLPFLIITGIHHKYSPPASLLPILYVLSFLVLICRHFIVSGKAKRAQIFWTSDSFW